MDLTDEMQEVVSRLLEESSHRFAAGFCPVQFPSFTLLNRYSSNEWFAHWLKEDRQSLPFRRENGAVSTEQTTELDATPEVLWDDAKQAFVLPQHSVGTHTAFHVDFLALLSEEAIERIVSVPSVVHPRFPLRLTFCRDPSYCVWDNVFANLLLHRSPLFPPPFLEARKMLTLKADLHGPLDSEESLPLIGGMSRLHAHWRELSTHALLPGYLTPLVDVKEKQVTHGELDDNLKYRHILRLDPENPPLFIMAYPEEGDPFQIDPAQCRGRRYWSDQKIESYTLIALKQGKAIFERMETGHGAGQFRFLESHKKILAVLDMWRRNWTPSLQPFSFLTLFSSTLPTRGDLQHLLSLHPLASVLGVRLRGIEPVRDKEASRRIESYWMDNERLLNYGWAFYRKGASGHFSPLSETRFHMVADFDYSSDLPEGFEIFSENLEDYLCSCLSLSMGEPYRFLSRWRKEQALA